MFVGTANPFYGTQVWKLSENEDSMEMEGEDVIQEDSEGENSQIGIIVGVFAAAALIFLLAVYKKRKQK